MQKQKAPRCPECKAKMDYKSFMVDMNGEAEWDGDFYCPKCEGYTITHKLQQLAGFSLL